MFYKYTNEEFLENLKKYNVKYIPLEPYKKAHTKMKFQCDINPNHIFEATPSDIYCGNTHCPYCMRRKVFVGETDVWTERPDIAKMLLHPEDGYKYFATGFQRADFVCPNCGTIVNKSISNVSHWGLVCPNCSDGRSFAEKLVAELLNQLKIKYSFNRTIKWSGDRRYDFYCEEESMIIETHGMQHYKRMFKFDGCRTVDEEQKNDVYKKELALTNGIKYYIELDCRYSKGEFIKRSIINSDLSKIYDLSQIDWVKCFAATNISGVYLCAEYWNNGVRSSKEIAKLTNLTIRTVVKYLNRAALVGICDYKGSDAKNADRCKPVMCIETGKTYDKTIAVKEDGYNNVRVGMCCRGLIETANGLHWRYI